MLLSLQHYAAAADSGDAEQAKLLTQARVRPSMFVCAEPTAGLCTVDDLRAGIRTGHAKALWETLHERVDRELSEPVISPYRMENGERILGNRSYTFVARVATRILDTAMVALLLEEQRYIDATLAQIMVLFDEEQWPEWSDQAHLNAGLHADLRHGQLAVPVAIAYDWLYPQLTLAQREAIVDGLDRCAIAPYKRGFAAGEPWSRRRSNWLTVVLGGFGIVGMSLGPDHPESEMLVANSLPQMETYLDSLGPEGEFNESVQYAGSMSYVVRYFMAMYYASGGADNPFERHSLAEFYRWYMHMTFPPGRVAGFGDPAPNMPPVVVPAAAVAAATKDPLSQWFYEQYEDEMLESHRKRALELIYYDADLDAQSPDGVLPLARAYSAQGMLVSSRSSWHPDTTVSVVYGKAGRESYHGHADWGQVCIDGYGEPLVVDLGSPPGYPRGKNEFYYNYQQFGHNVFVIGENDTGGVSWREKDRNGAYTYTAFDESRGAAWQIDLSNTYGDGADVHRTVVHLLPRIAVVLDEATLSEALPISLRWHVAREAQPDADGSFVVETDRATLVGRMLRLEGEAELRSDRHAYQEPYDKNRLDVLLKQRNEPYIELAATGTHCRVLTLFAVLEAGSSVDRWVADGDAWIIATPEGVVRVRCSDAELTVEGVGDRSWNVPLGDEGNRVGDVSGQPR
jgi:hypothetical protein